MTRPASMITKTSGMLAALALAFPAAAGAERFPPIGVKCAKGTQLRVDVHGSRDVCVAEAPPTCPEGLSLQTDVRDHADACAKGPEDSPDEKTSTPRCPKELELTVGEGPDVCERTEKPFCRKGYKMKVGRGPDMCRRR